ncbi:MAG: hypothetical protein V1649_01010 [Patescibacteria group bacterium]
MNKKLFGIITGIILLFSVAVVNITQATSLTSAQINAIVSLLQSFKVDATTIANVKSALNGTPNVTTSVKWCYYF